MSGTPHYTLVGHMNDLPEGFTHGFVRPVYEHEGSYYRQKLTRNYKGIEDFKPLDKKQSKSVVLFDEQKKDIVVRWYDKPAYVYLANKDAFYGRFKDDAFHQRLKEVRGTLPWRSIDKEPINKFLKIGRDLG